MKFPTSRARSRFPFDRLEHPPFSMAMDSGQATLALRGKQFHFGTRSLVESLRLVRPTGFANLYSCQLFLCLYLS